MMCINVAYVSRLQKWLLLFLLLIGNALFAQTDVAQLMHMQTQPECYGVVKTDAPIQIDGKDDEKAWDLAPWTNEFVDIEGAIKPKPTYRTTVKMLWDDEHLYVYAKMEEPHIWGLLTKRDTIIYHDNDFEVFIKPYEHHPFYYEIEVNPLNTVLDLMMSKAYRIGGDALIHWDCKHLKSAVHVEGTLNDPADTDRYWAVEMAIPFRSLAAFSSKTVPNVSDYWRVNFSRVQWQHEILDGKYARKTAEGRRLPEDNWVWSPIGVINMHYPERWGYIQFVESATSVAPPKSHAAERIAWNIFYGQRLYHDQHGSFAHNLEELPLEHLSELYPNKGNFDVALYVHDGSYMTRVVDKNSHLTVTLDNFGNYTIKYEQ